MIKRRVVGGIVLLLALVSLSGCSLDRIAAQQEDATGLWDELLRGESFGQTFVSAHDNLYRVDLSTATYARVNSAPVIFHLQRSPGATTDILTLTLPGAAIQNERPTSFTFPPLSDSRGQSYYFYISSPDATAGDAITVYAHAGDLYPGGTAYRNGQAAPGDLAFTAFSRETFTAAGILRDFGERIVQDPFFFAGYGLLLVAVGLAAFLFGRRHPSPAD